MKKIQDLIATLDKRIENDYKRMHKWRLIHRTLGIIFSLTLIVIPAIIAVGFTSSETTIGKVLLIITTIIGGLSTAFEPFFHSHQRRQDMNDMRLLHDQFSLELSKTNEDEGLLADIYDKYAIKFHKIYGSRGKALLDQRLSIKEGESKKSSDSNQTT